MGNVTIWNGVNAKNLATDYSFSSPTFDGMLVGNQLTHNASTGIISGGVLSINADTTKFDLSAGTGQVINYTTPTNPSVIKVSWGAFTAQTVTGLASQDETYIMIDSAGAISQLSNFPTPTERRAKIFIGRVGHSTRSFISFATSFPDYGQSVGSQMFDLYDALGPFNISGNQISNNGANLGFQKSAGSLFFRSFNYPASPQTPHVSSIASASPASFFYRDRDSVFTPAVTVIDPTTYDVAGVQTAVPNPGATATIQRVYVSPNGTIQVQYGQNLYSGLAAAVAAIGTDPFIINPALVNTSVLIGYIVVQKNCLSLADTATSAILRAPKFEAGVGGGVNAVTSLQQTYNSSTQPQIVLTSGQGGVQVYDNATPIGADLFTVANNGGGTKYLDVTSAGITTSGTAGVTGTLTAGQIIDSGLTASSAVYANASKQLTSATLTNGQLLVGSTGANPVAAALTAGTGVTITNGAGTITVAATTPNESSQISNLGISATASAGTITIALKQADGTTDPASGAGAVVVGFRDATATNGNYTLRSITAATSMTIAGATTLGGVSGTSYPIYIYAFDNAGTITLGASLNLYDEGTLQTSSTTTTSNQVIYQASALTTKPVRLIAKITATNTAGSWAAPTNTTAHIEKANDSVAARYTTGAGSSIANASTPIIDFATKDFDTHNAVTTGASWKFTAPVTSKYRVSTNVRYGNSLNWSGGASVNAHVYKGGASLAGADFTFQTNLTAWGGGPDISFSTAVSLMAGEYIDIRTAHGESTARALVAAGTLVWVSIERIGN